MEPAVIHGFQRYRIRGQVFPGTIRSTAPGAQVQGLVLFDLQPNELEAGAGPVGSSVELLGPAGRG